MIAFVSGQVASIALTSAVIEVGAGGIGLEVQCNPATLAELRTGAAARLSTSLVVREDSWTLFGFADEDEKQLFELVQTASGVGPKLAQAMLAVHSPESLRTAVLSEDVKALTTVPGVGQKGAQRIILELKDRIGPARFATARTPGAATAGAAGWQSQVHAGLVGLGWSVREADAAVTAVASEPVPTSGGAPDVAALLRAALRTLRRP